MKNFILVVLIATVNCMNGFSQSGKTPVNTAAPNNRQFTKLEVDLAVESINFATIKKSTGDVLRVTIVLKNAGGLNYVSNPNQQNLQLFEELTPDKPIQVKVFPFQNVNAGASMQFIFETPAKKPGKEFLPNYRAVIVFEPDIRSDNNTQNDDNRAANNSLQRNPRG